MTTPPHLRRHRWSGARSVIVGLALLLPGGCGTSVEVSDERGYWENEGGDEPDLSGLRRADLELTSSVSHRNGDRDDRFVVSGSLVALDKRLVLTPVITVIPGTGVALDPVPDACVRAGDGFDCRFAEALESEGTPPTPPMLFQLSLVVEAGVADPSVRLTATSNSNPLSNDPDPANNTAWHSLTVDHRGD